MTGACIWLTQRVLWSFCQICTGIQTGIFGIPTDLFILLSTCHPSCPPFYFLQSTLVSGPWLVGLCTVLFSIHVFFKPRIYFLDYSDIIWMDYKCVPIFGQTSWFHLTLHMDGTEVICHLYMLTCPLTSKSTFSPSGIFGAAGLLKKIKFKL